VHFFGLYCIIILQCTVQKHKKYQILLLCVCLALVTRQANLIFSAQHYIVICGICLAVPDFFTLTHKRHGFLIYIYIYILLNMKCEFWFFYNFYRKISHSKKNSGTFYHKCINLFMYRTRYFCHMLNETWIFFVDFQNFPNIKFLENPTIGSRVVPCGHAGRQAGRWADRQIRRS
jgi:hypothetical protein